LRSKISRAIRRGTFTDRAARRRPRETPLVGAEPNQTTPGVLRGVSSSSNTLAWSDDRLTQVVRQHAIAALNDREIRPRGDPRLEAKFAWLLRLARRVRAQERGQRGPKVYRLHAPEVECIGKGKPHKPYEFGVKVSVATTLKHSKGGQFVAHAQALPGNPYDGHTLPEVIPAIEQLVGNTLERLHADAGYRGHDAPSEYKFKV
jgi:IS5 family transposase